MFEVQELYTFVQRVFLQGWFCGLLIIAHKELYMYERERERERDREKLWMMKEKNSDRQRIFEAGER